MKSVGLLFTDIEGSTRLVEQSPSAYAENLRWHHGILRSEATLVGGTEFLDAGDGLGFAFADPEAAARAALAMQATLQATKWPRPESPFAVRMALHWTPAEFREGQYRGPGIHLISRILSAAHGGQVLASGAFAEGLVNHETISATSLGTYQLRGFQEPEPIFQLATETETKAFPPLRADHARQHNLPAVTGKFFGRTEQLAVLAKAFQESGRRVVTLTGSGGSGKSRLALAAAEQLLTPFDHGVYFVPLAELTEAAAIPPAMLAAIGDKPRSDVTPVVQLAEVLKGAPTLFILDNFEQFSAEGAAVVNQLLDALEGTVFLVTSRARIGIPAEFELPLPPFPLPETTETRPEILRAYECVQLWLDGAQKVGPDRTFAAEELPVIAEICRLVDGLPLAIELVSARVNALTTAELRDQLAQGLGHTDAATRNRLEATFEWSLRLLPPPVTRLLESLSVFRGGWTIQSAAAITGLSEVLTQSYLHYLLICSLIKAEEQSRQMRFSMLIPVREFAEARLGSRRKILYRRHIHFFRKLVKDANAVEFTKEGHHLKEIVDLEAENILAGMAREPRLAKRLRDAIEYQEFAKYGIPNRALRQILAAPIPRNSRVDALTRALAGHAVGLLDGAIGDRVSAYPRFEQAARELAACGRIDAAMAVKFNLTGGLIESGQSEKALAICHECLAHFQSIGNLPACAGVFQGLGLLHFEKTDFETAMDYFQRGIQSSHEGNALAALAANLCGVGECLNELGKPELASKPLIESVEVKLKAGKHAAFPYSFYALAYSAILLGRKETAAVLLGIAESQARKFQLSHPPFYRQYITQIVHQIREALPPESLDEQMLKGSNLPQTNWLEYLRKEFLNEISQTTENQA